MGKILNDWFFIVNSNSETCINEKLYSMEMFLEQLPRSTSAIASRSIFKFFLALKTSETVNHRQRRIQNPVKHLK